MFKAVIIETPGSKRSEPLVSELENSGQFDIVKIRAEMFDGAETINNSNYYELDRWMRHLNGRSLLPKEFGCTLSHNKARQILAESSIGGVIFEDDARVRSVEDLALQLHAFFLSKSGTNSVLSLVNFRQNLESYSKNYSKNNAGEFFSLLGHPELAVAYALTSEAASEFLLKNSPARFLADWPIVKSKFYVCYKPVVDHGDVNTRSIIDPSGGNRKSKLSVYQKIGILRIIRSCIQFRSYSVWDQINLIYLLKLYWHFDNLRFRLRNKR